LKIKSLRISNILSFKHEENIENCEKIQFDKNLNILIGPNGAGKSNFLEILSQIFKKCIVKSCNFQLANLENYDKEPARQHLNVTLTDEVSTTTLTKNYQSDSNSKQIEIEIELNENDYSNLIFVLINSLKIKTFLKKYSRIIVPAFDESVTESDLRSIKTILFKLIDTNDTKSFVVTTNASNTVTQFIQDYFLNFEFLQNLIKLANTREGESWPQLKTTFALIGGYRNFNQIDSLFHLEPKEDTKLQEINSKIKSDTTKESKNEEPVIFSLVKHKLAYRLNEIEHQITKGTLSNTGKNAMDFLKEEIIFKNIDSILQKYLKIRLEIVHKEKTTDYYFIFKNLKDDKDIRIFDLSSGEKGIIHFIFSVFGYDLKDGLLIIDEPELHLHPQIQRRYLKIIQKIIKDLNIQFILATHSPIFVNYESIENVFRFYKNEQGFTKIVKPTFTADEKDLIHILTYTNSSKVFFNDKVILVEGDADEYFHTHYLEYYKNKRNLDVDNIEILNINGKGNFRMWREFLTKYGIFTYYVADTDNLMQDYVSTHASAGEQNLERNYFLLNSTT
jgi:predicted ATP-dependent endonuclease of OLD family